MDLSSLYRQVAEAITRLDLNSIWPGFEPLKFALFDNEKCFFDGHYIEKTDAFCANTSIVYEGEQIAIWMVQQELDISVLTSKIVHEMFHGFQTLQGWDCWPNELEALLQYEYSAENLCLKLRENELMLELLVSFDSSCFSELLSLRKLRSEKFTYQFSYEMKTEEIEGTANYVEWQVLKQLDVGKAVELEEKMRAAMTEPKQLFPIRISCYYTGALMINALLGAGKYRFETAERPAILAVLKDVAPSMGDFPGKEDLILRTAQAVGEFNAETVSIIQAALQRDEVVLNGPLELKYVNIYDARFLDGYLTSTFFLMYSEKGDDKMIPGNFVIRMKDEKTINTVYRWK